MTTETRTTPFREDRQYGEPYAENERVYRTIDLTHSQLGRLPMYARIAIARADATNSELLAALEYAIERCARYDIPTNKFWKGDERDDIRYMLDEWLAEVVAKARGDA